MTDERLAHIADLVARATTRMDPERCFALLTACEQLLDEARRARVVQGRLGFEDVTRGAS